MKTESEKGQVGGGRSNFSVLGRLHNKVRVSDTNRRFVDRLVREINKDYNTQYQHLLTPSFQNKTKKENKNKYKNQNNYLQKLTPIHRLEFEISTYLKQKNINH